LFILYIEDPVLGNSSSITLLLFYCIKTTYRFNSCTISKYFLERKAAYLYLLQKNIKRGRRPFGHEIRSESFGPNSRIDLQEIKFVRCRSGSFPKVSRTQFNTTCQNNRSKQFLSVPGTLKDQPSPPTMLNCWSGETIHWYGFNFEV